jgi:hypothetical protein
VSFELSLRTRPQGDGPSSPLFRTVLPDQGMAWDMADNAARVLSVAWQTALDIWRVPSRGKKSYVVTYSAGERYWWAPGTGLDGRHRITPEGTCLTCTGGQVHPAGVAAALGREAPSQDEAAARELEEHHD